MTVNKQNFYLIIRQDDLDFLDGNHCAAALMSVFRNTHKWKLETDERNKKTNDIAEQHGDARWLSEDVLISFTIPELLERILNLFGRNAVMDGLKLLEKMQVISIHANPNQKYKYDQGRYFRFYPEVHAKWLRERDQELLNELELDEAEISEELVKENNALQPSKQVSETSDSLKLNYAEFENKLDSSMAFKNKPTPSENKRTPFKNKPHIDINNKINNQLKNKSLNTRDDSEKQKSNAKLSGDVEIENTSLEQVIGVLQQQGFPSERFQYDDVKESMHELISQGATVENFVSAHEKIKRSKGDQPFAASYLIKAVQSNLSKKQKSNSLKNTSYQTTNAEKIYTHDFKNGMDWMGDLVEGSDT